MTESKPDAEALETTDAVAARKYVLSILLFIAIGGALGAVSRWTIGAWVQHWLGRAFPFGTLAVNLLGCFAYGVVHHVGETTDAIPDAWRAGIAVGVLGALTTFSTFSFETVQRLEDGQVFVAVLNVVTNVVLCLLAMWAGLSFTRLLLSGG